MIGPMLSLSSRSRWKLGSHRAPPVRQILTFQMPLQNSLYAGASEQEHRLYSMDDGRPTKNILILETFSSCSLEGWRSSDARELFMRPLDVVRKASWIIHKYRCVFVVVPVVRCVNGIQWQGVDVLAPTTVLYFDILDGNTGNCVEGLLDYTEDNDYFEDNFVYPCLEEWRIFNLQGDGESKQGCDDVDKVQHRIEFIDWLPAGLEAQPQLVALPSIFCPGCKRVCACPVSQLPECWLRGDFAGQTRWAVHGVGLRPTKTIS